MDELRIRITFTLGRSAATGDCQHKSQRYRYETFRTIIKRKVQKERRTTKTNTIYAYKKIRLNQSLSELIQPILVAS